MPNLCYKQLAEVVQKYINPVFSISAFSPYRGCNHLKVSNFLLFEILFCVPSFQKNTIKISFIDLHVMSPEFHLSCLFFNISYSAGYLQPESFFEYVYYWLNQLKKNAKNANYNRFFSKDEILKLWEKIDSMSNLYNCNLLDAPSGPHVKDCMARHWITGSDNSNQELNTILKGFSGKFTTQSFYLRLPGILGSTITVLYNNKIVATIDYEPMSYPFYVDKKNDVAPWIKFGIVFRNQLLFNHQKLFENEIEILKEKITKMELPNDKTYLKYFFLNSFKPDWVSIFRKKHLNDGKKGNF